MHGFSNELKTFRRRDTTTRTRDGWMNAIITPVVVGRGSYKSTTTTTTHTYYKQTLRAGSTYQLSIFNFFLLLHLNAAVVIKRPTDHCAGGGETGLRVYMAEASRPVRTLYIYPYARSKFIFCF